VFVSERFADPLLFVKGYMQIIETSGLILDGDMYRMVLLST